MILEQEALGARVTLPDVITLPDFRVYWQARVENMAPVNDDGKTNPADVYAELWHAALSIAEVTLHGEPVELDSAPLAVIRWVGTTVGGEVTAAAAVPKSADSDGGEGGAEGADAGDRDGGSAE